MKLVSWQPVLTEHQVHLMRSVQANRTASLRVIAGARTLPERQSQGWVEIDGSDLDYMVLPKRGWWRVATEAINQCKDAVHLFGGIFADRRFFWLMLYCRLKGIKIGLMSEPYAEDALGYFSQQSVTTEKAKSFLRPLMYRLAAYLVGRGLFAFFPISDLAAQQFKRHGFRALGIYPFAYFVPRIGSVLKASVAATDLQSIRIIFVGSFIKRKGVGVLLEAWDVAQRVSVGMKTHMQLDIYGTGQLDDRSLPSNVHLNGPIPFGKSQSLMAQYDALILPSLHDGWGVVVNEALLQGVPALVSDRVGAQVLVKASNAGAIFKADSVTALAELFVRLADDPLQLKDWAIGARKLAHSLEPSAGADYLLACLEHAERGVGSAPTPPWTRL